MILKFKNWLVPVVLALAGSIDLYFGIIQEVITELDLPPVTAKLLQLAALAITIIITKKQPPSLKGLQKPE